MINTDLSEVQFLSLNEELTENSPRYAKRAAQTFFLSLTNVMVEIVLIFCQIFEMEILMGLQVMRSPESKITFLAFGRCVCV